MSVWFASRYNFWAQLDGECWLLLNGRTGAFYALSSLERDVAVAILAGGAPREGQSSEDENMAEALREGGFLVPDPERETAFLRAIRETSRANVSRIDCSVAPTYECNFRCRYCYVHFKKGRMSREGEGRVGRFLEGKMEHARELSLTWFGGEPLLCAETICRLTMHLKRASEQRGVEFRALLATNGYSLGATMTRRLLEAGVRYFHVTIDGPRDVHDRMRFLEDGGATFERVLSNVIRAVREFPDADMTLRTNVDESNVDRIDELLCLVPEDCRKRIQLNITPICGGVQAPSRELYRRINKARILGLELGYHSYGTYLQPSQSEFCGADRPDTFQIGPHGELFKCSPWDKPEVEVGALDREGDPAFLPANQRWLEAPDLHPECDSCPYLCFCGGGCRLDRLRGTFDGSCRDRFADMENLIVYRYLAARAERSAPRTVHETRDERELTA